MYEIDDVGTNKLSLIFVTWSYNFMPKYCNNLVGQVCVMVWQVNDIPCARHTFSERKAVWIFKS